MAKDEEGDLPDAATTLRHLARLSFLWRGADFEQGLTPVQWEVLRYLAVANQFSRTPGAVTKYLGLTKGTLSQSLALLEKKGLVAKSLREEDLRSVSLALTDTAYNLLGQDQRKHATGLIASFKPKTQRRMALALQVLVSAEAQRLNVVSFGACPSCRYFRERQKSESAYCMKFEFTIEEGSQDKICVDHHAR
jgi:DNA-binding MarR family transcriptional regulator